MNTFRNLNELYLMWNKQAIAVVNYVTEKAVETIKNEIEKMGIGEGGSFYEPTGEFEEAFTSELASFVMNEIQGSFFYDGSKITTVDEENFIHASAYYHDGSGEATYGLAEIIFEGKSGDLFGKGYWTAPRNAWDSASDIINNNIDKWFKDAFKQQGIALKK